MKLHEGVGVVGIFIAFLAYGIEVRILHTNDLHARFLPERLARDTRPLGGFAQLKTILNQLRTEHTVQVDAGEWSEGGIFFSRGGANKTRNLLESLGYEAVGLGEHDLYNGFETLSETLRPGALHFLVSNIDWDGNAHRATIEPLLERYWIKEFDGIRVAFIGLMTYDYIRERGMGEINITEPFFHAMRLASDLKRDHHVDAVVALSHNSIFSNQWILRSAPDLDMIISGRDHAMYGPVQVSRLHAHPGWIVEAGSYGQYVGAVDIEINKGEPPRLIASHIHPVLASTPQDEEMAALITKEKSNFDAWESIGIQNHLFLTHGSLERADNLLGHVVADAYREALSTDIGLESSRFIYEDILPGDLSLADLANALTTYHIQEERSNRLAKLSMAGRDVEWLLNLFIMSHETSGFLSISGLRAVFDLMPHHTQCCFAGYAHTLTEAAPPDGLWPKAMARLQDRYPVRKVTLEHDQPLIANTIYTVALSEGVLNIIRSMSTSIPVPIDLSSLVMTDIQAVDATEAFMKTPGRLSADAIEHFAPSRFQTLQANLGFIRTQQYLAIEDGRLGVHITVHNLGAEKSHSSCRLKSLGIDPQRIPELEPGAHHNFSWFRENLKDPVQVKIECRGWSPIKQHTSLILWPSAQ